MQQKLPFNNWLYKETFCEEDIFGANSDAFQQVSLPHANKELPFNYFDETIYQFVSCYRKNFTLPEDYKNKRVLIEFEGVANYAEVYLNGKRVGEHKGAYTQFTLELTQFLQWDKPNTLIVQVDSTERDDIPPFGYLIDFLSYGGIYREVSLIITDELWIENVHAKPIDVLSTNKALQAKVFLNSSFSIENVQIVIQLMLNKRLVHEQEERASISAGNSVQQFTLLNLQDILLWDINSHVLYELVVTIGDTTFVTKVGFRQIEYICEGFFLNGEKIKLRGLNRHQSYPYVGYAMPMNVQRMDADILRYELGVNIVRTSHYPQSRHFLDRCDEIGLLVFEELPGWQHIGDDEWKHLACSNVHDMIMRDYNHPSIVIWGVRINESQNDFSFYEKTNEIAHSLDDTRPTGGVKYVENIDFQEDVFVMNDFDTGFLERKHRDQKTSTGLSCDVPYLISEFVGIYFPTKRFDPEERRVEQALRHAYGHDEISLDERVSGAIAWCAFDYNTHYEFGPGDRICYHGVMDMFRISKWAGDFYSSQINPREKAVLMPATVWSNGDRQNGGFLPLCLFTNCDSVDFYFKDTFVTRWYPSKHLFGGLEHPPILVEKVKISWDNWCWEDAEFVGILDGEEACRKKYAKNPCPTSLIAASDTDSLTAQLPEEAYDATRIVIRAVDQCENMLDFMMDTITFKVTGPAEIIGPKQTTMQGGCIGVWLRTTGKTGEVSFSATSSRLISNEIKITVR